MLVEAGYAEFIGAERNVQSSIPELMAQGQSCTGSQDVRRTVVQETHGGRPHESSTQQSQYTRHVVTGSQNARQPGFHESHGARPDESSNQQSRHTLCTGPRGVRQPVFQESHGGRPHESHQQSQHVRHVDAGSRGARRPGFQESHGSDTEQSQRTRHRGAPYGYARSRSSDRRQPRQPPR